MKTKKIIRLINNERMNRRIESSKACDATSTDVCAEKDNASCTISSYDLCIKDYKSCTNNSIDFCSSTKDFSYCSAGETDY